MYIYSPHTFLSFHLSILHFFTWKNPLGIVYSKYIQYRLTFNNVVFLQLCIKETMYNLDQKIVNLKSKEQSSFIASVFFNPKREIGNPLLNTD